MTDLDAKGMYMNAELKDKSWKTGIFVGYTTTLTSAAQIRKLVVAMHKEAYAALGWKDDASGVMGVVGHALGHFGATGKAGLAAVVLAIANMYVKVELR